MKIIGLASDHAGYDLKCIIKDHLEKKGYDTKDYGCYSSLSCDYPDFAHLIAYGLENSDIELGFVFCGSGNGINMTVNKHPGVRSALCWNTEIAELARRHNDANICSLPARFITESDAKNIVDVFLDESFDEGRHLLRVKKIPLINK
ncbi:MAG TPA: RpiB/LacA/LacB family sugar-phosphate isomerase [Paludibacter sp.]|nr:RpiB/LacA/LacB family sugar-phosphate isomerase [Prolixibacteraceae bacterium]